MTSQKRYKIEALLNRSVQPFEDVDDETLIAIGTQLDLDAVPIVISEDGILIDGHQRLRAMLAKGRKTISVDQVKIKKGATAENAFEWAVKLGVNRRHLSMDGKVKIARYLIEERKWSQTKVGNVFGISRQAVSQWLSGEDMPERTVIGEDEKERHLPAKPAKPKSSKQLHAWEPGGYIEKSVSTFVTRVRGWLENDSRPFAFEELRDEEIEHIKTKLEEVEVLASDVLLELAEIKEGRHE